jgi:CDP-glucose 4,6-dehydratase
MPKNKASDIARFYNNKTILITGNTGFKGTWLSLWLNQFNCEIIGISSANNNKRHFYHSVKSELKLIQYYHTIDDLKFVEKIILKHKPDIIFHLAAQPLVSISVKNTYDTIKTNLLGTTSVLEVCKKHNLKANVIIVSTDNVYQERKIVSKNVKHHANPYMTSKSILEQVASLYHQLFFSQKDSKTRLAIVKSGNVYGGGDFAEDRFLPDVYRAYISDEIMKVKNLNDERPWIYIHDICWEYINLVKELHFNKTANGEIIYFDHISSIYSIHTLLSEIRRKWKALRLNKKLTLLLGERKMHNQFKSNIEDTLTWYDVFNNDRKKIASFSMFQIESYLKKLDF